MTPPQPERRETMTVREYPVREIYTVGRYIQCQILNWDQGPPPKYLVCNSLDPDRPGEFLAHQAMGTWMKADLRDVVGEFDKLRALAASLREGETR